MTSRAEICSEAIHKALFPRADAIHRMANSRRQIAEIVRAHFPEADISALPVTVALKTISEARDPAVKFHPASDPSHVAD